MKHSSIRFAAILGTIVCLAPIAAHAGSATAAKAASEIHFGDIAKQRNDWNAAIKHYRAAIALAPRNGIAHSDLGWAYVHTGKMSSATDEFKAALKYSPLLSTAESGLHLTLTTDASRNAYMHELQVMAQKEPGNASAHTMLAEEYVQHDQFEMARAEAISALRIAPKTARAYCVLGRVEAKAGNDSIAKTDLEKAIKLDAGDDTAWAALGDLQTKATMAHDGLYAHRSTAQASDTDSAVACYRRAVNAQPDVWEWHAKLAAALTRIGDSDGAAQEEAAAAAAAKIADKAKFVGPN